MNPHDPFTIFTYHFAHGLKDKELRENAIRQALVKGWIPSAVDQYQRMSSRHESSSIDAASPESVFEKYNMGSSFLLSSVRSVLYPQIPNAAFLENRSNRSWLVETLSKQEHFPLRLRLSSFPRTARLKPWSFRNNEYSEGWKVNIEWVEIILFETGVGYLTFKAIPLLNSTGEGYKDLARFNGQMSIVEPRQKHFTPNLFQVDLASKPKGELETVKDWIWHFIGDFMSENWLAGVGSERSSKMGVYSYCWADKYRKIQHLDSEFASMDLAAYHLAGGAEIREGALPDRTFLNSLLEKCRFAHWQDWTVMCLRDGVGLAKMGSDGPLKWSVDSLYFEVYLFALHQREALVSFQEEINDIDMINGSTEIDSVYAQFIAFRKKYWPIEISDRPLGSELFRSFVNGQQTERLYKEIGEKLSKLHAYAQAKATKEQAEATRQQAIVTEKNDRLINFIAIIFFPITVVTGILGINLSGETAQNYDLDTYSGGISLEVLGMSCLAIYLIFLILWLSYRLFKAMLWLILRYNNKRNRP